MDLGDHLRAQARAKRDRKLRFATEGYLEFLSLGGRIRFRELSLDLILNHLKRALPDL